MIRSFAPAALAALVAACTHGAPREPAAAPSAAGLHERCPDAGCAAGQTCVEYCGIAGCGPGRPTFRTCEIPCATGADCPQPLACGTIADGPGRVCLLRDPS